MIWVLTIGASTLTVAVVILARAAMREGQQLTARIDADRKRFLGDSA